MKGRIDPRYPRVFECTDTADCRLDAKFLLGTAQPRSPEALSSRLAQQFLKQNSKVFDTFEVSTAQEYDGTQVSLVLRTGIKIGALPLFSPTSGRPDYGLIIRPRFDWTGIGSMLAVMGWRIVPALLKLPLLPGTERRVPPWVLSSVVLVRIKLLLAQLDRRFEITHDTLGAPKGTIDWTAYATRQMPVARMLSIPCSFPDLRDDSRLLGVIHYTLRRQLASLLTQRHLAGAVTSLIELCNDLLHRVAHVSPQRPTPTLLYNWFTGRFHLDTFREGIQALQWTDEERGLAGLAELQGLPWMLPMDAFFEAWVEVLAKRLSRMIGGNLRIGRLRETIVPIQWDTAYASTQKYLQPDLILELEDTTIILDAKYKRHWEEFQDVRWTEAAGIIKDEHRDDLMQVLAYSNLSSTTKTIACLVYPCQPDTYFQMLAHQRHAFHATIPAAGRQIEVIMTAVPMNDNLDEVTGHLAHTIKYAMERV